MSLSKRPSAWTWCDFNSMDNGHVWVLPKMRVYKLGGPILLGDDEGNRCAGKVIAVLGRAALVKVDMSTWESG